MNKIKAKWLGRPRGRRGVYTREHRNTFEIEHIVPLTPPTGYVYVGDEGIVVAQVTARWREMADKIAHTGWWMQLNGEMTPNTPEVIRVEDLERRVRVRVGSNV